MFVTVVFKKSERLYKPHKNIQKIVNHQQPLKNLNFGQLDVFTKFFYGQSGCYLWLSKIAPFTRFGAEIEQPPNHHF